jgi:hypothetical protein
VASHRRRPAVALQGRRIVGADGPKKKHTRFSKLSNDEKMRSPAYESSGSTPLALTRIGTRQNARGCQRQHSRSAGDEVGQEKARRPQHQKSQNPKIEHQQLKANVIERRQHSIPI